MPGKIDFNRADDLIKEHRSGLTVPDLMRKYGIGRKPIERILGDAYETKSDIFRRNTKKIIGLYKSGMSEKAVSDAMNIGRNVITRIFNENGIKRRSASEAETLKWKQMSASKRKQQLKAAHDATRGRPQTIDHLLKRSKTQANIQNNVSKYETKLMRMLQKRGHWPVPQLAIGPYNCDLALHPVAVEVWAGGWHFGGTHLRRFEKRTRYIMNAGWHVLIIVISGSRGRSFPLTPAVADYVISYVNQIRSKPSSVCQYRVVWGAGEETTGGSLNDDKLSCIPPFTAGKNTITRKYERVRR